MKYLWNQTNFKCTRWDNWVSNLAQYYSSKSQFAKLSVQPIFTVCASSTCILWNPNQGNPSLRVHLRKLRKGPIEQSWYVEYYSILWLYLAKTQHQWHAFKYLCWPPIRMAKIANFDRDRSWHDGGSFDNGYGDNNNFNANNNENNGNKQLQWGWR